MNKLRRRYPLLVKLGFTLIVSLLTFFLPCYPLKFALGVFMIVLLGLTFRRLGILFIVLAVVFIVVPVGIVGIVTSIVTPSVFFTPFSFMKEMIPFYSYNYGHSYSFHTQKVYPDKFIKSASNVYLNVKALEIVFDPELTGIEIPSQLTVKRTFGTVNISLMPDIFNHKSYIVKIGTKNVHDSVHVQSKGLEVKGNVNGKIDFFSADCEGIVLNGLLKANNVRITCQGLCLEGEIDAENIEVNAEGVYARLSLRNTQNFSMNCEGVDGSLTYEDHWEKPRLLSVKSAAGKLIVRIPKSSAVLNVESKGAFIEKVRY